MILICDWCKKIINPGKSDYRPKTTYIICKPCTDELRRNYKISYPIEIDFSGTAKEFVEKIRSK